MSQEKYPLEAFLDGIRETDPATTRNVAEQVGCSYRWAYKQLNEFQEDGAVSNVTIGNTFVWSVE